MGSGKPPSPWPSLPTDPSCSAGGALPKHRFLSSPGLSSWSSLAHSLLAATTTVLLREGTKHAACPKGAGGWAGPGPVVPKPNKTRTEHLVCTWVRRVRSEREAKGNAASFFRTSWVSGLWFPGSQRVSACPGEWAVLDMGPPFSLGPAVETVAGASPPPGSKFSGNIGYLPLKLFQFPSTFVATLPRAPQVLGSISNQKADKTAREQF